MTCKTIPHGDTTVTICYGSEHREMRRTSEGLKWCFRCRSHQEFFFIITAPVVPDYYGLNAAVRCGTCNTSDGDLFPGREREWE